jgi:hypothetical protein
MRTAMRLAVCCFFLFPVALVAGQTSCTTGFDRTTFPCKGPNGCVSSVIVDIPAGHFGGAGCRLQGRYVPFDLVVNTTREPRPAIDDRVLS